jgi:hypothetical protein
LGLLARQRAEPSPFTAFEHLAYADQFYQTFYKAPTFHPSISWPRYFLLCHSIELALKAYLAKLGATPQHLKQWERGNKLDKLVAEASRRVCI